MNQAERNQKIEEYGRGFEVLYRRTGRDPAWGLGVHPYPRRVEHP